MNDKQIIKEYTKEIARLVKILDKMTGKKFSDWKTRHNEFNERLLILESKIKDIKDKKKINL